MKIMYIHGFGSEFKADHPKVQELVSSMPDYVVEEDKPVEVVGISIDYSTENPVEKVINSPEFEGVDLIVGTSMGGWTASMVGVRVGLPWVAINPALRPSVTLAKYVMKPGETPEVDFAGREIRLSEDHLKTTYFMNFCTSGGMVILDRGDELFDADETVAYVRSNAKVVVFNGGSHRFDHMKEAIPHIARHWNVSIAHGV